jgi:ubiquitin-protein ligase
MSFIWNWWSGSKKEDENEEKGETEDKKEENETVEIEEIKEVEKGEIIEKEEKDEIEEENENENEGHRKKSSLSGVAYELEEDDNNQKNDEKENKPNSNKDENNSIKKSLKFSDKKQKKIVAEDLSINKDDPLHWKSMVYGPENSPYENGRFEVSINFEENKPNEKPKIKFLTKIYHFNVEQNNGEVLCPFIWNTTSSEKENLKKIKLLMNAPDSRFPCSKFIQEEYYNNFPRYKEKALKFTEDYAMN